MIVAQQPQHDFLTTFRISFDELANWINGAPLSGYDHFDLHELQYHLKRFSIVMKWIGRIDKIAPTTLRRSIFIKKRIFPETVAVRAQAEWVLTAISGAREVVAIELIDWLLSNSTTFGKSGIGWGLPFNWHTRETIPAHTPCATTTVLCGEALLAAYESTGNQKYLDACMLVGRGLVTGLNTYSAKKGICFSYTSLDNMQVHNANLLVARYLLAIGEATQTDQYVHLAHDACEFSISQQREDGSLNYIADAQSSKYRSDHYHSAYDLLSLHRLRCFPGVDVAFQKYLQFYVTSFIADDGQPRLYPGNASVVDLRGCSEGIAMMAEVCKVKWELLTQLQSVTRWTIENMQSDDGFFYSRWTNGRVSKAVYARMQSGMYLAFAKLQNLLYR